MHKLYEFDEGFVVDEASRILLKDGATVRLTPKAFETLLLLVQHAERVVDKDHLLKEVWPDSFVEEGSLSRNIYELRRSLGDDPAEPRFIETIPKRGYRFIAPVRVTDVEPRQIVKLDEIDTIIEKHTYARVVTRDVQEEFVDNAGSFPVTEREDILRLNPPAPAKQKSSRVVIIIAVLALGAAAVLFVYSKRSPGTPTPVAHSRTTLVRLTKNEARDHSPVWSPDGGRIAFWSNRDGTK
jgi:DNA-binding winged helix-turn-helix (wHTH) protein